MLMQQLLILNDSAESRLFGPVCNISNEFALYYKVSEKK